MKPPNFWWFFSKNNNYFFVFIYVVFLSASGDFWHLVISGIWRRSHQIDSDPDPAILNPDPAIR